MKDSPTNVPIDPNERIEKPFRCHKHSGLVGFKTHKWVCHQCGRSGPEMNTPWEAVLAWNNLHQ